MKALIFTSIVILPWCLGSCGDRQADSVSQKSPSAAKPASSIVSSARSKHSDDRPAAAIPTAIRVLLPKEHPLLESESTEQFKERMDALLMSKGWSALKEGVAAASLLEERVGVAPLSYQDLLGLWAAGNYLKSDPKPDLNGIFEALSSGKSHDAQTWPSSPGIKFLAEIYKSPKEIKSVFDYYLQHPLPHPLVVSIDRVAAAVAEREGYPKTIDSITQATSPQVRDAFISSIVDSWIGSEPEAASLWIKNLPDGDIRGNAVKSMVLSLAQAGDFESARAWMPFGRTDRLDEMNSVIKMYEAKFNADKQ